jgi:hypothetical protein
MSTPPEQVEIDIAALDAKAAEEAANKAKSGPGIDDTPEIVVESPAETTPAPKPHLKPEEGIAKLQKQLDDERAARIAAESRAHDAAQAEVIARTDVQKTQLDLVTSAIERVTAANDTLESQYATSAAAGDWTAAAKAQREMATNAAKLAQLEAGKSALEKAPKPTARPATDPVDQFTANLSAPSAAWVRAHPEFVRDTQKNQQMIAAHQLAMARGLKADTPEYFTSIEKTLDLTAPTVTTTNGADHTDDDPMASAAQPTNGGRQAAPAAPVTRSGSGNGSKPGRVTLTRDQVEAAHASFPDSKTPLEDYARQVAALRKEGKLQ